MKHISTHFLNNIFSYFIVLFIIIVGIVSYNRFLIKHDYMVEYEKTCDSTLEKCFVGCEDDGCVKEYYYSRIQKYASDLYAECGKDITDCENANICLPNDQKCSVTYCDSGKIGNICRGPIKEVDKKQNNDQTSTTEENLLQKDDLKNNNI